MALQESYSGTANYTVSTSSTSWYGQSFTTLSSYSATSVKLLMYKFGTPGIVTVSIYASSAGKPTGNSLATGTTDGDTLTTNSAGEWREITFSAPYSLSNATMYCIVVSTTPSGGNGVAIKGRNSAPLYSGGTGLWSNDAGSSWSILSGVDLFFEMYGGVSGPSTPTLDSPTEDATGIYLNKDWLLQMMWDDADAEDISLYTVWFYDPNVGWMEQTDRSRYSIVGYFMWLGYTLEYDTTYSWFVRKTIDEVDYDSDTWSFTTTVFDPPVPGGGGLFGGGAGDGSGPPNTMKTYKRLVAAANNKIWYEDV